MSNKLVVVSIETRSICVYLHLLFPISVANLICGAMHFFFLSQHSNAQHLTHTHTHSSHTVVLPTPLTPLSLSLYLSLTHALTLTRLHPPLPP